MIEIHLQFGGDKTHHIIQEKGTDMDIITGGSNSKR